VDNAFASRFTTGTNVAPDTGEIADDLASASLNSLSVLGLATKSYTVKMGDTLSAIATQFGTTVSRLVELNSIQDANLLYIGQVLKLP
jgi:lysozyme